MTYEHLVNCFMLHVVKPFWLAIGKGSGYIVRLVQSYEQVSGGGWRFANPSIGSHDS